jgi:hypothetical protein
MAERLNDILVKLGQDESKESSELLENINKLKEENPEFFHAYVDKLEKSAEEADMAYMAGAQFANQLLKLAAVRQDTDGVPDELVEKTASRHGVSDAAHLFAEFGSAILRMRSK